MTVIVWDGKTLAADRQIGYGGATRATTKIFRVGSTLVGFSGNASIAMQVLQWLKDGAQADKYPNTSDPENDSVLTTIIITSDGRVSQLERTPYPINLSDNDFYCIGAGADFAYGALAMGATAREAVEVANKYSQYCGHGVDVLGLGV